MLKYIDLPPSSSLPLFLPAAISEFHARLDTSIVNRFIVLIHLSTIFAGVFLQINVATLQLMSPLMPPSPGVCVRACA